MTTGTLAETILHSARQLPEGAPLSAKALLHLGSRAAVDQALSRLARRGELLRAGTGIYVRPVETAFGRRPPSPAKMVQAIALARGETVARHGAAAANALGLTTQVPVHEVYLTSGRSRRLRLGSQVVEMRRASSRQLALAGRPAGDVIRALEWLGPEQGAAAIEILKKQIPRAELEAVVSVRSVLPQWMAEQFTPESLPWQSPTS